MTNSNCKLFLGLKLTSYIQAADDSKRTNGPAEHSALSEIVSLVFIARLTDPPPREGGRWETKRFIGMALDPREKISSPIQDLFCSRKPLTYPGSASVQCGLHGRTEYPLLQSTRLLYPNKCKLLVIFQTNINLYISSEKNDHA